MKRQAPADIAATVLSWLERQGAVVILKDGDRFHVDLNPVNAIRSHDEAERIARVVFDLREDIRRILVGRKRRTRALARSDGRPASPVIVADTPVH